MQLITITVSTTTSHSVGTVQVTEESESGIRSEKRCDLRRQQKTEREGAAVIYLIIMSNIVIMI